MIKIAIIIVITAYCLAISSDNQQAMEDCMMKHSKDTCHYSLYR